MTSQNINKLLLGVILLLTMSRLSAQEHDIVVVANTDNTSIHLEKVDIRNLFMGNASGIVLEPVALSPETLARAVFNTKIIGLTESRIQAYWSQMRFSGRARRPKEFDSVQDLIDYVTNHKETVTFLPAGADIPKHLTVIYQTRKITTGS